VQDRESQQPDPVFCEEVIERAREYRLLLGKAGSEDNTVLLAPPLNITSDDIEFALEVIECILEANYQTCQARG